MRRESDAAWTLQPILSTATCLQIHSREPRRRADEEAVSALEGWSQQQQGATGRLNLRRKVHLRRVFFSDLRKYEVNEVNHPPRTEPVKQMGVFKNNGTPKSSILIGFSIIPQ